MSFDKFSGLVASDDLDVMAFLRIYVSALQTAMVFGDVRGLEAKFVFFHQLSPTSGINHIAAAMKMTGSASQGIICNSDLFFRRYDPGRNHSQFHNRGFRRHKTSATYPGLRFPSLPLISGLSECPRTPPDSAE